MKLKVSSSILLVLLCLGAFHFNQVQAACDASVTTECATCDDTTTTECLTCNDHYAYDSGAKSCSKCSVATKYLPTGKTLDSECVDGPANCKTLNVDGTCKTCNDQYVLSGDAKTCGACADKTKYLPSGKTLETECVAGPTNCAETNIAGTCKTCADHYVISGDAKTCGTCSVATKYLPTGKTLDSECIDGPANCKTLNVDGTCKTCATNYVLSGDAKTCGACSDKTKYLPSGKTLATDCVACTDKCTECNVDGTCKTCADGTYLSDDKKTCKACDTGCAKCTGTGAGKCTTCSSKYWAKGEAGKELCAACDAGCDVCTDNGAGKCTTCSAYYFKSGDAGKETCTTCPAGKYLPAGKSAAADCASCPDGKYMKAGGTTLEECLVCDTGCAKCTGTGSGKCTECSAQFYLDSTCKSCGDGKYLPDGKTTAADCATCDAGCAKCTGTGADKCTTCKDNYYLDSTCKTCTDKTKYVPIGKSTKDDCVACALKCTECNTDGTCKTCETGRYVKDGKCTPCSKGCTTCGNDGKCTVCADGYYLNNGACTACTTGCTKCDSATKCTACDATAYYLSSDACKTCSTGCTACGSDGKCTDCASGYYYDSAKGTCAACTGTACTTCGADLKCTKCSSGYVLDSKAACTTCPTGCTECGTDGKCTKCDYNYSFLNNACTACPTGSYVGAGTELAASCTACTAGQYYSETEHKCKDCFDKANSNCKACYGPNIGQCVLCNDNFNLVSGACRDKNFVVEKRTGSSSGSIRFDMDLDKYISYGGPDYFVASTSKALGLTLDQVQVTGTQVGSVIVLFTTFSTGTTTPAELTQAINSAIASGQMSNLFGGAVVMDSNAVVLLPGGCPSGTYYDSANYECKNCTDDICGKKKSKVGAIVGGVLGGIALIIIIGILIWKKDVLLAKMRSPKIGSAQYNGLATKSPAVKEDA